MSSHENHVTSRVISGKEKEERRRGKRILKKTQASLVGYRTTGFISAQVSVKDMLEYKCRSCVSKND